MCFSPYRPLDAVYLRTIVVFHACMCDPLMRILVQDISILLCVPTLALFGLLSACGVVTYNGCRSSLLIIFQRSIILSVSDYFHNFQYTPLQMCIPFEECGVEMAGRHVYIYMYIYVYMCVQYVCIFAIYTPWLPSHPHRSRAQHSTALQPPSSRDVERDNTVAETWLLPHDFRDFHVLIPVSDDGCGGGGAYSIFKMLSSEFVSRKCAFQYICLSGNCLA